MSSENNTPPTFKLTIVGPPRDREDHPPVPANLVTVDGGADTLSVNFFYLHPTKIHRIVQSTDPVGDGYGIDLDERTIRIESNPVASVALPMTTALDLMVQLYTSVSLGMPELLQALNSTGERLQHLGDLAQGLDDTTSKEDTSEESDDPA